MYSCASERFFWWGRDHMARMEIGWNHCLKRTVLTTCFYSYISFLVFHEMQSSSLLSITPLKTDVGILFSILFYLFNKNFINDDHGRVVAVSCAFQPLRNYLHFSFLKKCDHCPRQFFMNIMPSNDHFEKKLFLSSIYF